MDLPVYEAVLEEGTPGITAMSLVGSPAVISGWRVDFSERRPLRFTVDVERHNVFGVVMRADFPIYRNDSHGEYYILYRKKTIKEMARRLFEKQRHGVIDIEHDGVPVSGVSIVQLFIKDEAQAISPKGFEDIEDGSLFAEYHIDNPDIWAQVASGTLKGFSLEGFFKVERMNKKVNMKKMSLRQRLARMLAVELAAEPTDKGILTWADGDLAVGIEVNIEDENGDGQIAPDGDYTLTDGRIVTVKDGKVENIKDPETEAEPQENADEPAIEDGDYTLTDGRTITVKDGVITAVTEADTEKEEALSLHERTGEDFSEYRNFMNIVKKFK